MGLERSLNRSSGEDKDERLTRGVKVAVLGPPHSGKTVILQGIQHEMDSTAARLDVSHGDGEGSWFENNYHDSEVRRLRRKIAMGEEGVGRTLNQLETFSTPLALMDVGGRIHDDNRAIVAMATHAIILGETEEVRQTYAELARSSDVSVIAMIDNRLTETPDSIATEIGSRMLRANVGDLHRGTSRRSRMSVIGIALKLSDIVDGNSLYEDKNSSEAVVMNPRDIIAQIGREQNLEPRDVQRLYEVIRQNYQQGEDIKIDGRARSWEYAAIAFASYRSGARSVSFYSPDGYVSLKSGEYEDANRIEHDEYDTTRQAVDSHTVHIEVRLNVAKVTPDILNELTIPTVDSSKTIIISGRMPMWLAASVALSYKDAVEKIAYFVPGQEAPVVWARDESDLGSVVSI